MDLPNREIDSAYLYEHYLKLLAELEQEVVDLTHDMSLHAVHADLPIHIFVKPFNHCVLHFADALKVREVFLQAVAIRCQVAYAVVVSDVILPRQWLHQRLQPDHARRLNYTHQRHQGEAYLRAVFRADGCYWYRVRSHVTGSVELPLLFVDPLPAGLRLEEAVKLKVNLLLEGLEIALVAVTDAADLDSLASTRPFDEKLDDQVNAETFLAPVSDLVAP